MVNTTAVKNTARVRGTTSKYEHRDHGTQSAPDGDFSSFSCDVSSQTRNGSFGRQSKHTNTLISRDIIEDGPRSLDHNESGEFVASRHGDVTIWGVEVGGAIFLYGSQFTIGISYHHGLDAYVQLRTAIAEVARTEGNHVIEFKMLMTSTNNNDDHEVPIFGLDRFRHLVEQELPGVTPMFRRAHNDIMWGDCGFAAEYSWTMDRNGDVTESFNRPQMRAAS